MPNKVTSKNVEPTEDTIRQQGFNPQNLEASKADYKKKVEKSIWLGTPS